MGVFARILIELAAQARETGTGMIDATHARAHWTAASLTLQKGARGRTTGGLNAKRHVLADARGRPTGMFLSAGQTSDCIGARALLSSSPRAGTRLADRGRDADPCRLRHEIGNMFARLKDWPIVGKTVHWTVFRSSSYIATRCGRCAIPFIPACALAPPSESPLQTTMG